MKEFYPRRIRPWILFAVLLTLFIIGFIYMHQTPQIHTTFTATSHYFSTTAYPCMSDRRGTKLSFLGSRPFCIHLLHGDIVSDSIARSGSWMPHQTKLISLLLADSSSKPAVFLDIGANIGWFTIVMAVLGHKVIAIEPMSNNVELMQSSLQASQVSHNVIVHSHGLGTTPGECILYSDNHNIGDGHMICGVSSEKERNALVPAGYSIRQVIHSTRLDALVSQNIDVIKIDVEGSELHAVRSGSRLFDGYNVRHIISEFSPGMMRHKNSDPYEYLNFFVSRGYNIRIINDDTSKQYEKNTWQTMRIYKSEQELRQLSNPGGIMELWFTKN